MTRPVGRQLQQVWAVARPPRVSSARQDTPAPPSKPQPRHDLFLLLGMEFDLFELCLLQSGICFAAMVFWTSHSTHWSDGLPSQIGFGVFMSLAYFAYPSRK